MRRLACFAALVVLAPACGPPSVASLVADREYAEAVAATHAHPDQRDAVAKALLADLDLRVYADVIAEDRLREALGDAYPTLQGRSVVRVLPTWNPVEELSVRATWKLGGAEPADTSLSTLAEMSGERRYPSSGETLLDTGRGLVVLAMATSCGLSFGIVCPSDGTMSSLAGTSDAKYAPNETNAPKAARVAHAIAKPGVGLVLPAGGEGPIDLELSLEVSPVGCEVPCGGLRYRAVMPIPAGGGSMHERFARHFAARARPFAAGAVQVVR